MPTARARRRRHPHVPGGWSSRTLRQASRLSGPVRMRVPPAPHARSPQPPPPEPSGILPTLAPLRRPARPRFFLTPAPGTPWRTAWFCKGPLLSSHYLHTALPFAPWSQTPRSPHPGVPHPASPLKHPHGTPSPPAKFLLRPSPGEHPSSGPKLVHAALRALLGPRAPQRSALCTPPAHPRAPA